MIWFSPDHSLPAKEKERLRRRHHVRHVTMASWLYAARPAFSLAPVMDIRLPHKGDGEARVEGSAPTTHHPRRTEQEAGQRERARSEAPSALKVLKNTLTAVETSWRPKRGVTDAAFAGHSAVRRDRIGPAVTGGERGGFQPDIAPRA